MPLDARLTATRVAQRVRRQHCCRPLPKEPPKRLSPQAAQAQLKYRATDTGLANLRKPFANIISLIHPIAETRALNCSKAVSPSFPASNLKYGPATATPRGSLHPFGSGQSSNPYPFHYRAAFAFSAFSYPLHRQLSSRIACHLAMSRELGGGTGLPRSRFCRPNNYPEPIRLAPAYPPVALWRRAFKKEEHNRPPTFLVRAYQQLWLFLFTRFNSSSLVLRIRNLPRLHTARLLAVSDLPVTERGLLLRSTLSPKLHTRSLPIAHARVGNCWSHNRSQLQPQ